VVNGRIVALAGRGFQKTIQSPRESFLLSAAGAANVGVCFFSQNWQQVSSPQSTGKTKLLF